MKTFRRILSAVLAIVMIVGTVTAVGAANVSFTDVSGHWAWTGGQIPYLVDKGVINGYKQNNGTYIFKPDGEITRAEFIKILDETFGLTATAAINFKDVTANDWYYPYFAKAAAQGYILNYGNYATPTGKITREEAIALLVRYLDLPASEKASTSEFADYNTISDNFKDYVLRGVYAGLITGYNENGVTNFKPKKTLTRAEALTILYRAAGSIFNQNAYSRDSGAPADHNVVTKGDVTIRGITLNGRNIVSEGATSGTITFSKCTINGTLYIRGSANVIFDDCVVENVVVTGGGDVSLLNDTTVDDMTVKIRTTVKVYSGTKLNSLTVANGADYSSVSGDGSLYNAVINARGFNASMIPVEFNIGNNLSAVFGNVEYSGSSDTQNSFTLTPFVTADKNHAYLNLISDVDGELYFYYSNSDFTPTVASFDSYYESTSVSGHFSVAAGDAVSEATVSKSTADKYSYLIMQLQYGNRKYAPVTIPNTILEGTGFTTDPYVSDNNKVKFQAKQGGIVFCYYTNSGTGITQLQFLKEYSETESALKKEASVTSLKSYSIDLNKNYLENYSFVAFMLKSANGQYYTPVILPMGDNGFATEPVVTEPGKITFKTSESGDLYYYYAESAAVPSAEDFKSEYNRAEEADRTDVKRNNTDSISYDTKLIDDYPYMVMSIRTDEGYMQPVSVYIEYSTGFEIAPEMRSASRVRFKTEDSGTVFYYYTTFGNKNPAAPTVEDFKKNYQSTRNSDEINCRSSLESFDIDPTLALSYPYMVFMFVDDDGKEHSPVLLSLDIDSSTGFSSTPTISKLSKYDYYLSFKTSADGEVWYFYAKDDSSTSPSEFREEWNYGHGEIISNVSKNEVITEKLDDDRLDDYPYVIIAFYDDEDEEFSYPIVLDVFEMARDDSGTGLSVSRDGSRVTVEALFTGDLYWYHTDASDHPDSDEFYYAYRYSDSDWSGVEALSVGKSERITVNDDYDYLIICLERREDSGKEVFMEPVVINLSDLDDEDLDDTNNGATDAATSSSYGFDVLDYDYERNELVIEPYHDGVIKISMTVNGSAIALIGYDSTIDVTEDDECIIELPELNIFSDDDIVVYLQLKNDKETYKAFPVSIK